MKIEKPLMLFDSDCGFCQWSADKLKKFDKKNRFEFIPYQNFSEEELKAWGLSSEKCHGALQLVTPQRKIYSGAFAFNYFGFHYFPSNILVSLLYLIPIFLIAEILTYRWIAKNRYRVSQWLGLSACSIERPH